MTETLRALPILTVALLLASLSGAPPAGAQETPPFPPPVEEPPGESPEPAAEQPPEPPAERPVDEFGEELEVSEVILDVVAVDRRGHTVPGLTEEDFVVREDGEPVEVTSVQYYTTSYEEMEEARAERGSSEVGAAGEEIPSARYFVLFFHGQATAAGTQGRVTRNLLQSARYARQWVDREMQPSDWIAVVRYDQNFTLLADFTQDREEITDAIEGAMVDARSDEMRPSLRRRLVESEEPRMIISPYADADHAYDAVELVAEGVGHIVGRKNLILFSLGFGQIDSAFRTGDSRYYPEMEEALNANNVAVYPIDLAGQRFDSRQTAFLSQLADDTGGELFKNFHSYAEPFRRISRENAGYYLVTFRTEHPVGETGYRDVEVEATAKGVRVRARKGYRYGAG